MTLADPTDTSFHSLLPPKIEPISRARNTGIRLSDTNTLDSLVCTYVFNSSLTYPFRWTRFLCAFKLQIFLNLHGHSEHSYTRSSTFGIACTRLMCWRKFPARTYPPSKYEQVQDRIRILNGKFTSLTEAGVAKLALIRSISGMFEHMNLQRISLVKSLITFGTLEWIIVEVRAKLMRQRITQPIKCTS